MKLKPKIYPLLEECVKTGINAGYRRAYKHNDMPKEELIKEQILHYIMLELSEKFNLND